MTTLSKKDAILKDSSPESTHGEEMGKNSGERSDGRFSLRGVRVMKASTEMVCLNRCPVPAASRL